MKWMYSREEALKAEEKIDSMLKGKCIENGYRYPEFASYTSIKMNKCGDPEHLFTKEELIQVLEVADDRRSNKVVIDENGEVRLVNDDAYLYPVRNETFQAGNMYVGKYANVIGVANDLYPTLLGAWIDYLEYGKHNYIDYYKYYNKDVERLEKRAKELMSEHKNNTKGL